MSRKIGSIFLVFLCIILVLTGCQTGGGTKGTNASQGESGKTNDGAKKPAELEILTWWASGERSAGEAVIEEFDKSRDDIVVKATFTPYEEYASKLNTLMAAGTPPDVFYLNEYLCNEWGEKGVAADLKPFFEKKNIDLYNVYVESAIFSTGDSIWAIASSLATIFMYYNKGMFEANGIEPPPRDATKPYTWDEFVEVAKELTVDFNGKKPGEPGFDKNSIKTYGVIAQQNNWLYLSPLLYTNGIGFATDDGKQLAITSEKGIEVLKALDELVNVHMVSPSVAMLEGLPELSTMLMNDQVAMYISGSWEYTIFADAGYDVGVAALPMFEKPSNMVWASAFMMAKDTKHPDEAFDLLQTMVDYNYCVEVTKTRGLSAPNLPNLLSSYNDPEKLAAWAGNYNEDFQKLVPDQMTKTARTGECITLKNFGMIAEQTIMPHLDKLWLGEMTPEEVVKGLDQMCAEYLTGSWK